MLKFLPVILNIQDYYANLWNIQIFNNNLILLNNFGQKKPKEKFFAQKSAIFFFYEKYMDIKG